MYHYVTVNRDGRSLGALLGPFSTRDVAASWVDAVRLYVGHRYPAHAFDAYGIARSRKRITGRLSAAFGFNHH